MEERGLKAVTPLVSKTDAQREMVSGLLVEALAETSTGRYESIALVATTSDGMVITQFLCGDDAFRMLGAVEYLAYRIKRERLEPSDEDDER